eukprot:SM000001S04657  [mRNA]  locus=s1:1514672:1520522:- [translate_table: standard]
MVWCSYCGKDQDAEIDEANGFTCCTGCGRVLDDNIYSTDPTFSKGAGGASQVDGNFVADGVVPSSFGRLGGARGRVFGYQADSHEKTVSKGKHEIVEITERLKIRPKDEMVNAAHRLYKLAVQRNFTRGRRTQHVAGACLYIVCRQESKPYMLIDFSDTLQTNVYVLGAVFLQLCRLLRLEQHPIMQRPIDPSLFIHRFADRLEFGSKMHSVANTALRLMASMKRDWMQTGRRPSGVCGAALFISSHVHGFERSKRDVVSVVHVCEATLKKRLTEFESTESGSLTAEEFDKKAKEYECQQRAMQCLPAHHENGQALVLAASSLNKVLCEHRTTGAFHHAHGLCRACYDEFVSVSGGVGGGSAPPSFQRAEKLRLVQKQLSQGEQTLAVEVIEILPNRCIPAEDGSYEEELLRAEARAGEREGSLETLGGESGEGRTIRGQQRGKGESKGTAGQRLTTKRQENLEKDLEAALGREDLSQLAATALPSSAFSRSLPPLRACSLLSTPPPDFAASPCDALAASNTRLRGSSTRLEGLGLSEALCPPRVVSDNASELAHTECTSAVANPAAGRIESKARELESAQAVDTKSDVGDAEDADLATLKASSGPEVRGGEDDEENVYEATADKEETLSDIDDDEVTGYLLQEEEVRLKTIVWTEMNKEYLQQKEAKEAAIAAGEAAHAAAVAAAAQNNAGASELAAAAAAAVAMMKRERKQKRAEEAGTIKRQPAETAAEATQQMLASRKLSSKVNYSALAQLFNNDIGSPKTAAHPSGPGQEEFVGEGATSDALARSQSSHQKPRATSTAEGQGAKATGTAIGMQGDRGRRKRATQQVGARMHIDKTERAVDEVEIGDDLAPASGQHHSQLSKHRKNREACGSARQGEVLGLQGDQARDWRPTGQMEMQSPPFSQQKLQKRVKEAEERRAAEESVGLHSDIREVMEVEMDPEDEYKMY